MLQEITSWCNRNPILCAVVVLFILFYTGLLQRIIKMLRFRGLAPFPAAVNSDYMNPKSGGGVELAPAAGDLPSVPPQESN